MVSLLRNLLPVFCVGVLLLPLVSCSAAPQSKQRYFWPPLSDQPKIEYLGFFQADRDVYRLGANPFVEAVFGREKSQALFTNPYGVYADGRGKFYVTEVGRRDVMVADLNHGTIGNLKNSKGELPTLKMPTGIVGDPQGNIYVVDSVGLKILVFGPDDTLRSEWALDGVMRPLSLAVDVARKRIYLVDTDQHKIFVLDQQNGNVLFSLGKRGSGPGEFNFPLDVDLDADGNLYVLDAMNARVQVFAPDGAFLRAFGERGTAIGSFQIPKGLAVSPAGQVYVTDSLAHRLVVFSLEGEYLMTIGGKFVSRDGQMAPGGFYLPGDIDADATNGLWIVDTLNRMVHHFQYLDDDYLLQHPILPGQAVLPVTH